MRVVGHTRLREFRTVHAVVDASGNRYVQLSGYRTVALPAGASADKLKALSAVA